MTINTSFALANDLFNYIWLKKSNKENDILIFHCIIQIFFIDKKREKYIVKKVKKPTYKVYICRIQSGVWLKK